MNSLLDQSDLAVERARAREGSAHALKTPLQILAGDAEKLESMGEADIASEINVLAAAMRRTVDGELARARARTGGVAESAYVADATGARRRETISSP